MKETHDLSTFKTINEEIKTVLRDLEEKLSSHPHFDFDNMKANNEAFLHLLDQMMDARCKLETLKEFTLSTETTVSH